MLEPGVEFELPIQLKCKMPPSLNWSKLIQSFNGITFFPLLYIEQIYKELF